MTKKGVDQKNVEKFPLEKLEKKWPFSPRLAEEFFDSNQYGGYSSLKEFLISTWLEYERMNSEYEREYERMLSKDDESIFDSDDKLSNEKVDSWPVLTYDGFFIENNILYFKESINEKTHIYSLNDISEKTILVEAARFYANTLIQELKRAKDEEDDYKKGYRKRSIWFVMFNYILFTKHSFSIQKLIRGEKYFIMYKEEMISAFYHNFFIINNYESDLERLWNIEEGTLRERLKNLFIFYNLSTIESEKLIDNFFSTKSLNEIISHNK